MLIAPDGPACGANVLGVTRDGATAWALAKPAVIERQTAAEAIANHLLRSRRRALSLLRPNLLPRRCCYAITNSPADKETQLLCGELR